MLLIGALGLCLGLSFGFEIVKEEPPRWSPVFTVKAVLNIPYAEIREPIYTWYDSTNGKSRIDYYGGMAKTIQLSPKAYLKNGVMYKVVPVTTEKFTNKQFCFQISGEADNPVGIQSSLPDLSDFKFIGTENVIDANTTMWRLVNTKGEKVNKYTMWVKFRKTLKGESVPIPVRFEMKGYNSLYGSHYDHYYIDYQDYDVEDIDSNVFTIDSDLKCQPMNLYERTHTAATFNPLKEFIHPTNEDHVHDEFSRFKTKHNKAYKDDVEHLKRLDIFRQNLRFVHSKNRERLGFSLGINHLADKTSEEIAVLRGRRYNGKTNNGGLMFPYSDGEIERMSVKLPPEFDWRLFGAVTPVKDQSVCGSCWSFGTTGAVEGALFLHNGGHLVRLSQQALVDCSWGFENNGCDGGLDTNSYKWIMKHGLPTEDDYGGYLGADGYCHIDNVTLVTSIKGWVNVTGSNENALKLAIFKHGPISVAIDASLKTFSFYSHGVFYDPDCKNGPEQLDHAVLAVGYGVLNGQKYWLVKNSWSNLWGNDGYILISMKENNCGVETMPTYVLM